MPDPEPQSPRSPRPALASDAEGAEAGVGAAVPNTATTGGAGSTSPVPGAYPAQLYPPDMGQPRGSLSNLLFMAAIFFFMSNGNQQQMPIIGPDGEIKPRVTEFDVIRQEVGEWEGYLAGNKSWAPPPKPLVLPAPLTPLRFDHHAAAERGEPFFFNMTGWYRRAMAHTVDLSSATGRGGDGFFHNIPLPAVNESTAWNATLAQELRGEFDWAAVSRWDIHIKGERRVASDPASNTTRGAGWRGAGLQSIASLDDDGELVSTLVPKWTWVKGGISVGTPSSSADYTFYGLHHVPNGTYGLFGVPSGMRLDIRSIPGLFPDHHNETAHIILGELRKELKIQEDAVMTNEVRPDDWTSTRCPLLVHLSLPPLPEGTTLADVVRYEYELANPTGILASLKRPPSYWHGVGLGGVAVADQCGFVMGIDHGRGVQNDDFLRRTINYAAFATISQLIVLFLLVRQMERTRTPSTLAKVSLWTIALIGISDSWIFSAHLIIGILSNNRTDLVMLVPGFCALCTAIVFGPRYAVLLHRIQAPERSIPRPRARRQASTPAADGETAEEPDPEDEEPSPALVDRIADLLTTYPGLKWVAVALLMFIFIQIALMPAVVPFVLFLTQSIWLPQIYRNARRGSSGGLGRDFILGTSIGRLALPLYALACPANIFFVENASWVWSLILWQVFQVSVLFAQDRFGPAFFLPKSLAPAEGYDYHPLLPAPDAENPDPHAFEGGTTCSICMEEVDTRPPPGLGLGADVLSSARRAYAVAPCHHLFHTKCLQQWMVVKSVCPLCKRPLPPL